MKTFFRRSLSMLALIPTLAVAAGFEDAMLAFENRNYPAALSLAEPLAKTGDPAAMTLLGRILDEGMHQPSKAFIWYRQAAVKGYAEAQLQLAELYDAGEGVTQDIETAVLWYEKAAEKDNEEALIALAQHYTADLNHQKSAVPYYERAAGMGNATAQYQLGLIYLGDNGIARDDVKAWLYLSLAADRIPEAAQARDVLEINLGEGTLSFARKALADWEKSH